MIGWVEYKKIDDKGLHIEVDGQQQVLDVDNVVICAGQVSNTSLYDQMKASGERPCHLIGGAFEAAEIDAKRAIKQGVELANKI